MANPAWVQEIETKDNVTINAVVLRDNEDERVYISWDGLSLDQQKTLIDVIDPYGEAPLEDEVGAEQVIQFKSPITNSTTLGLDTTVDAPGTARIVLDSQITRNTELGIVDSDPVPSATQAVMTLDIAGATIDTEILSDTEQTEIFYTLEVTSVSDTYTVSISSNQNYTLATLAAEIDSQIFDVSVSANDNVLVFTSADTGSTAIIQVAAGSTLFAAIAAQGHSVTPTSFSVTGQDATPTNQYQVAPWIETIITFLGSDTVPVEVLPVVLTPTSSSTVGDFIDAIEDVVGNRATVTFTSGVITITPQLATRSVTVSNNIPTLPGYSHIEHTKATQRRVYTVDLFVDNGTTKETSTIRTAGTNTVQALVLLINDQVPGTTSSITNGNQITTVLDDDAPNGFIEFRNDNLFKYISIFDHFVEPREAASDLLTVIETNRAPNGMFVRSLFTVVVEPK